MPFNTISKIGSTKLAIGGWCLAVIWLVTILAGFVIVINFDLTPGAAAAAPRQQPAGIESIQSADRPLLILFAHPRCPCTRATLGELNHILTECPGAADVRIFFSTPTNPSDDWMKTALWADAAVLPHTTAVADPGGVMAERFDVKTSGQVLLYSAKGKLLFSGGITAARGEEGANRGRSAIVALLKGQSGVAPESQVFGCPLSNSLDASESGKTCPTP